MEYKVNGNTNRSFYSSNGDEIERIGEIGLDPEKGIENFSRLAVIQTSVKSDTGKYSQPSRNTTA